MKKKFIIPSAEVMLFNEEFITLSTQTPGGGGGIQLPDDDD